jgi:acetyl-CoA carboxylase biotin carboxylase subunit
VPTVPGSEGLIENDEQAMQVAKEIGFPMMIKATAGGGGRCGGFPRGGGGIEF